MPHTVYALIQARDEEISVIREWLGDRQCFGFLGDVGLKFSFNAGGRVQAPDAQKFLLLLKTLFTDTHQHAYVLKGIWRVTAWESNRPVEFDLLWGEDRQLNLSLLTTILDYRSARLEFTKPYVTALIFEAIDVR